MLSMCLWIPVIDFWMPEPIFTKLAYCANLNGVIHKSLPSVCVSVCVSLLSLLGKCSLKYTPSFVARQRLEKHVPAASLEALLDASFSMQSMSIKGKSVGLCIHLTLLGNNSVKNFPRQRRIVGGVVFSAAKGKQAISSSHKFLLS
jgi:hypothetical protein